MGTISSGTGLVSGLDIQGLVKQLISIESQPLDQLKGRITDAQKQQQGYSLITANLLATKAALQQLVGPSRFLQRLATSSNESVLTASASTTTPVGNYVFRVKSLVTTHQLASRGFTDRDQTPVGAGTMSFEIGHAQLTTNTMLSELNGLDGIRRGTIRITDRTGASADVDLRAAGDINDLLDAINSQTGIRVRAVVNGDAIKLVDQSGGTGTLVVTDLAGGYAAADLGLAGVSTTGEVTGRDLIGLGDRTRLSQLNDGNGVSVNGATDDLRVTLRDGSVISVNLGSILRFDQKLAELDDGRGIRLGEIKITLRSGEQKSVDLSSAQTVQDVVDKITAASPDLSVSLANGGLSIHDTSGATAVNFKIEDVTGHAAADLGIAADVADRSIAGSKIQRVETVGAVIRAIRYATGNEQNKLQATISADGNGLILTDTTTGAAPTTVESLNGSNAARDLGLLDGFDAGGVLKTRRLLAGLNTVLLSSLNGGSGVRTGQVQFTLRDGTTRQVNFTGATTLSEAVDRINAAGGLTAQIDSGGTGLTIDDTTTGTGELQVVDQSGNTAADLHLTAALPSRLASGDLQLQYVSESTLLSDLNRGKGISFGRFRITDSSGTGASISLNANVHKTVGDVLKAINDLDIGVTAKINSTGDGIELVDSAGGAGQLSVADQQRTSARDLRLAGTAAQGATSIDGSYAVKVEIDGGDTLDDVATKINAAGAGVRASVLSQGAGPEPYFLSLTSETSGTKGRVALSTGTTGLSFGTLTQARDATLLFGDPNSTDARVIRSSSNTVEGVIDGLTLNLVGTSDSPVQVAVTRDDESIVSSVQTFIKTFNEALDRVDQLTVFNPDTGDRGVLQADSTARQITSELLNTVAGSANAAGLTLTRLSQVGIFLADQGDGKGVRLTMTRTLGTGAGSLTLDGETRLRDALQANPDAVKDLFTKVTTTPDDKVVKVGIAAQLDDVIDGLTQGEDSTLGQSNSQLDNRIALFTKRADEMQKLLDLKENRLYAQFQAMESSLASLQSQQSALSGLASQAASLGGLSNLTAKAK